MRISLREHSAWVLATLVVFNFLLTSLQVRNRQGTILLKVWMMDAVAPLSSLISRQGSSLANFWRHYVALRHAQRERDALARENEDLRLELARHREYKALVERYEQLNEIRSSLAYRTQAASIISKSPPFVKHMVTIDRGRQDAVARDSPVLAQGAVIGRVFAVSERSAEVELITNSGAAAGVLLQNGRLQGIVEGRGTERLMLNFIPNHEEVPAQELVLTSGTDQIYPKGLPVGRVVRSERSKSTSFREIEVEPLAHLDRIEEVLVVQIDQRLQPAQTGAKQPSP